MATATLQACRERLHATLRDADYGQANWAGVLNEKLRAAQELLWLEHDWPDLLSQTAFTATAGVARYAAPTDVTLEGMRRVAQVIDGESRFLEYGLSLQERVEEVDRSDWQSRWLWVGAEYPSTPIELWPTPNTTSTIYISFQKSLSPFTSDTHTSTLDGTLLVLWAAAEIAVSRGAKDANWRISEARRYLGSLRERLGPTRRALWDMSGMKAVSRWLVWRD